MNPFRTQSCIAILVAFTLLFAGMRVPDLSRPHRPKPRPRGLVQEYKSGQKESKQQLPQIVGVLPVSPEIVGTAHHLPLPVPACAPQPCRPLIANSGRSPPA